MPLQVPRLDNNRVAPQPLRLARPRPTPDEEDYFREAGTGLMAAAGVAQRLEDERDTRRVLDTETALKNEWLAVDRDLRGRAGANADGATVAAEQWLEKKRAEYGAKLDNDRQRQAFERSYNSMRGIAVDGVSRHEARERRAATDSAIEAAITSHVDLAAASADSPEAIEAAIGGIDERIEARARLRGLSPEAKALERQKAVTALHRGVLNSMIDKNPNGARAYYAKHKEEIAGTERAQIERVLEVAGRSETAQAFADSVVGKMGESAALAAARERFSGEDEKAAVAEIRARFGEREQIRQRAERDLADAAWAYESRGERIPASVWARLDGRTRLAIENERRQAASGARVETDWGRYYEISQQAASDPQEFLKRDLRQDFPLLAPGQRSQLVNLQAAVRNQDDQLSAATLQQQITAAGQLLELKDPEDKGRFTSAVQTAIQDEQRTRGRKLTQEERQKVIDRMMLEGELESGSWWRPDADRRYFEVFGTEEEGRFVGEVPAAEREKIVAAARKVLKREPTEAEILDKYLRRKAQP